MRVSQIRWRDATPAIAAALLLLAGCSRSKQDPTPVPPKDQPSSAPVRYVKVEEQSVPETLALTAKVQADPTKVVRIFPPAAGRVVEISVKPGDHVKRGEPVATLTSSDIASARSDYAKASIEANRATRAMERQKVLYEHGASAEKDFIDARAQADAANAELARTKQRLEMLNVNPAVSTDTITLVSPTSGVVLDISAAPGEFSKSLDAANPIVTVADINTVWIMGDVYEKDLAKLSRGKQVTVSIEAYPDREWTGHIDSISGALDPTTRTLKVRVSLPNADQRFKPEMFATIHVKTGTHRAVVVPAAAVIREGSTTTVFVKNAGNPEQRTVTVGQTVDGHVEILTGLRPGDEVAAEGAELLKGGPPG